MPKFSRYSVSGVLRLFVAVGVAYPVTLVDELHAQQNAIAQEVIQKWKEFESFSQTVQGTKRTTLSFKQSLQDNPLSYSDSYKQNRECVLYSVSGASASAVLPNKWWNLVNPRYAAEIKTSTLDPHEVVLKEYKPASVDILGNGFSAFDIIFFEIAPHFSYRRTRLSQLVTKNYFKIDKVSKALLDGTELVQLDFCFDDKKQQIQSHGSLYFDPNQCWCLRKIKESYVRSLKGTPFWEGETNTSYQTTAHPSGFPLLKKQIVKGHTYEGKDKKRSDVTMELDYEWEINDHVPDSEFTLAVFGLPEPIDVPQEKRTPWYLWFLAAAGGCAILAVLFRYLSRRFRPHPV